MLRIATCFVSEAFVLDEFDAFPAELPAEELASPPKPLRNMDPDSGAPPF